MTKSDLITLGEQLAAENNAAHDLWTWLPSYQVVKKHHGDYADEFRPSVRDIMIEAAQHLAHIKHPDVPLTVDEREWLTHCPCGEDHDTDPEKT